MVVDRSGRGVRGTGQGMHDWLCLRRQRLERLLCRQFVSQPSLVTDDKRYHVV